MGATSENMTTQRRVIFITVGTVLVVAMLLSPLGVRYLELQANRRAIAEMLQMPLDQVISPKKHQSFLELTNAAGETVVSLYLWDGEVQNVGFIGEGPAPPPGPPDGPLMREQVIAEISRFFGERPEDLACDSVVAQGQYTLFTCRNVLSGATYSASVAPDGRLRHMGREPGGEH
jgi:hypothetical protein